MFYFLTKQCEVSCPVSMMKRDSSSWLYWDSQSVIQSTTRGSCFPASRGYGQWRVYGLRFLFQQNHLNKRDRRKLVVLMQQQRTWGNKAFMKSLRHYIMRCHLIVLWYSILCKSLNTLNRCGEFQRPTGLRHRQWYYWNRTLRRYWCTFKRFKLCCGVKWLCSHAMVSTRKNIYILSL